MIIPRVVGAGVVAAGIGVGTAFAVRPLFASISDKLENRRYETMGKDNAELKPGEKAYMYPPFTDEEGFGSAMGPVAGVFATGGLLYAGVTGLSRSSASNGALLLGAGALALAGVVAGAVVGGIMGGSSGKRASEERRGIDFTTQVDELFRNFDATRDGVLNLDDSNGARLEYLRRDTYDYGYRDPQPATWDSIEQAATRADANHDLKVDKQEFTAMFASFDTNGNNLLSEGEYAAYSDAGLEAVALVEIG